MSENNDLNTTQDRFEQEQHDLQLEYEAQQRQQYRRQQEDDEEAARSWGGEAFGAGGGDNPWNTPRRGPGAGNEDEPEEGEGEGEEQQGEDAGGNDDQRRDPEPESSESEDELDAEALADPAVFVRFQRKELRRSRRREQALVDALKKAKAGGGSSKDKKLPTLKEKDARTWRAWRLQVEDILQRNAWPPQTACAEIMCAIGGEARHALGAIKPMVEGFIVRAPNGQLIRRRQTGEELLERLERLIFIPKQQEARERLTLEHMKQDNKETVTDYLKRYRLQFLQTKPHLRLLEGQKGFDGRRYSVNSDPDLLYGAVSGMRDPEVQHWVRSHGCKDIQELLQVAELREASLAETRDKGKIGASNRTAHMQSMDSSSQASSSQSRGGFKGDCMVCSEPGHTGRNCPMTKKVQEYLDRPKRPRNSKPDGKKAKKAKKSVQQVEATPATAKDQPSSGN